MRNKILILIFLACFFKSYSQNFLFEAQISPVDSSGFYNIFLPPAITSKLNNKFSDIRLMDKKDREIPYLNFNFQNNLNRANLNELEIIENQHKKIKKFIQLLIQNNSNNPVENLILLVEKPKVTECWITISGSDDQLNWFVIKTNSRYQPEKSDSTRAEIYINDLKTSNFKFYKIILFDNNKHTFEVNKIYSYKKIIQNYQFTKLTSTTISQDDSTEKGKTILKIDFSEPQYIDKIVFYISDPAIYYRKAEISQKDSMTGRKIYMQFFNPTQKEFYLNSDTTNELMLQRFYSKTLYLTVFNNDDLPLKFAKVEAFQIKNYLVAFLKEGQKYFLRFGNSNLPNPVYDIKFFSSKIPQIRPDIEPLDISSYQTTKQTNKSIKVAKAILWIFFFLVIALLAGISVKLFLNKRKELKINNDLF